MLELIVTMIIAGILSAVVAGRFFALDSFKSRGFYDESIAVVRYSQKAAIARRANVYVCSTATQVGAYSDAACTAPVQHPSQGGNLATNAPPNGVSVSVGSFAFDSGGRPQPNAQQTIVITSTIADDPVRTITVEAETGFVQHNP
ncbi:MAG: general secretion pathway protein GspH [Betaproteobacteria bacterium]|nr:general secretion pathway protein GspH [Betaproteobacteria bacterium]